MASFFQPPTSGDPVIAECNLTDAASGRRLVYCNRALAAEDRLRTPLQFFTLCFSAVCLAVPVLYFVCSRTWSLVKRWKRPRQGRSKANGRPAQGSSKSKKSLSLATSSSPLSPDDKFLGSIQSFQAVNPTITEISSPVSPVQPEKHAYIVPLPVAEPEPIQLPGILQNLKSSNGESTVLGCVNIQNVPQESISTWTASLTKLVRDDSLASGVILRMPSPPKDHEQDVLISILNELLVSLNEQEVPVIINLHHDDEATLEQVDLAMSSGLIVNNACILPDGQSRDYFRSYNLRKIMTRCAGERTKHPRFFVAFYDTWQIRPSPAVVCRAEKLARHFEAVFEHGPAISSLTGEVIPKSVSGFEVLRKPETTELQKVWTGQKKGVCVDSSSKCPGRDEEVASLDLEDLSEVIPGIEELFSPESVSGVVEAGPVTAGPQVRSQPSLQSLTTMQSVDDFWETTATGQQISSFGCAPLMMEATPKHYGAVVATQTHLRDLEMLHCFDETEVNKVVEQLRVFQPSSAQPELVTALSEALKQQKVLLYKGLATGFSIPDNAAEFWGVSGPTDDGTGLNIFVSRRCPGDTSTILHTWFAHHAVPRIDRYEEELRLEKALDLESKAVLPLSIRTSIEGATPFEALALVQRLGATGPHHTFQEAIHEHCRVVLLDQSSIANWNDAHSRRYQEGTITMEVLLQDRLSLFTRLGATQLPTLQNLLQLNSAVESLVDTALFAGDIDPLNRILTSLTHAYDPLHCLHDCQMVDINSEFLILIFLCALRKSALEDVYIEATDHCPLFSQPDQAAVFSELWVLGSQCELYFGMPPRALGKIIYDQHRAALQANPPPEEIGERKNGLMTVYAKPEPVVIQGNKIDPEGPARQGFSLFKAVEQMQKATSEFGALSIFCLPAMLDIVLLTFLGRGLFMTAFMGNKYVQPAVFALLISLLLSAGVTGWVGSVGNYYLCNYAYNNMVFFHVQRLSGGFAITLVVAIVGTIIYGVKVSVGPAFTFFAYVILIATYLNILGIMATMHQHGTPLTSGRTVLWRTMPVLFISPVVSTFVNGHDLEIYLAVGYGFLTLLLIQYRGLCHEWINWTDNIAKFTEKDIVEWYSSRLEKERGSTEISSSSSTDGSPHDTPADELKKSALQAFRSSVAHNSTNLSAFTQAVRGPDPLVRHVVKSMPYIEWLLKKDVGETSKPEETFSVGWFSQLSQALRRQQQMAQGLKEHNIFMLFRYSRYDIGGNVGLFIICLMDRWVSITMSANSAPIDNFTIFTSRYAICFAILYFCASVMTLDSTLQQYWKASYELSDEKLSSLEDADRVSQEWERSRRGIYRSAFLKMGRRLLLLMGCSTIAVWNLVEDRNMVEMYYLYILGYTAVIFFQFNRCFTTDQGSHVSAIFVAAFAGYATGVTLHIVFRGNGLFFADVIALNVAAISAAGLTSIWAIKDWGKVPLKEDSQKESKTSVFVQSRLGASPAGSSKPRWQSLPGTSLNPSDATGLPQRVLNFLWSSVDHPSKYYTTVVWSNNILESALDLWTNGKMHVTLSSRSAFIDAGLEDAVSIAKYDGSSLEIVVGSLGEIDLGNMSWELLAARVISEAILHHVARAVLGLTSQQAVHAEHILHGIETMSKRIELQLAGEDHSGMVALNEEMRHTFLRLVCFDTEVDSEWHLLPPGVRLAMFQQISGEATTPGVELQRWLTSKAVDIACINFHISLCHLIQEKVNERLQLTLTNIHRDSGVEDGTADRELTSLYGRPSFLVWIILAILHFPLNLTKWISIISGGGSHVERELWFNLRHYPRIRPFVTYPASLFWRVGWWLKNACTSLLLIYHHAALVNISRLAKKGASRTLCKDRVVVEIRRKQITGFASLSEETKTSFRMEMFDGALSTRPTNGTPLATAVYDESFRLVSRRDFAKNSDSSTIYRYPDASRSRYPSCKTITTQEYTKQCFYDRKGRVLHGTMSFGESLEYSFRYFYKSSPKNSHEILKVEFRRSRPISSDSLAVYWGTPLRENLSEKLNWVPSDRVCKVVRVIEGKKYITTSDYQHRRDPVMMTVVEETETGTRAAVGKAPQVFEHEDLFLQRPSDAYFENDDLLIQHRQDHVRRLAKFCGRKLTWTSLISPSAWLYRRKKVVYRPVPTWWLRTELWDHWRKSGALDAIVACWMDELILREEPLLKRYWSARNAGQLSKAKAALDSCIEQIVSAIEIEKDVSEVCLLPIKSSDLYAMGLSRDANELTMRPSECFKDTDKRISVIFNDIGCWPDAPGGVSNCRRDLVNGHSTIRNHVLAESANEYGIPRFQVEKSVQSLKMLPLWGLDGRSPNHGVIDNLLESEVDAKIAATDTTRDIAQTFVPLLKLFIKGARSRHISRQDMIKYSNAVLGMFKFFEHKDYNETWKSKEVFSGWIEAWLTCHNDTTNIVDPTSHFPLEKPSMTDFRTALEIYSSYFFIFSVQTPEHCPKVFQSTHHGISSLFGLLLKYRRGSTFGIWDHAILWRECCLNISPAQSTLSLPVQSILLSGISLAMKLAYFHADVVLPCTPVFNPIWEQDLGTDSNLLLHKNKFSRKIDPIVNGVSNMDAFQPVTTTKTTTPTVIMLSNVQFIKDIKTSILAADVIVNKYGFTDYALHIYGARDREPSYDIDMTRLIDSLNLSSHVLLKGFGKPHIALQDAWLFMNSSLSEGLPLAIAEAALAAVPIVATAVGATALVLTNPDDPTVRYGEIVPPNDPTALARAQIAMLAMAGPWAKYAGDVDKRGSVPPHLLMPENLTTNDVKWLRKRMDDKTEDRKKLGMMGRQMVLRGFHGKRYLREHEQMYWIQWHLSCMRRREKDLGLKRKGWNGVEWDDSGERWISSSSESESGNSGTTNNNKSLGRKRSVRWQEFTSGRMSTEKKSPYSGKRLSKVRVDGQREVTESVVEVV
ncbi:family 4 putative glycosyltransferase [Podospora fimiseda]|uniref:Family 4 putative glycosyltransferase n=1 Tax=Podospora fimiseda TaxID=252190 RepID=A0AAN7BH53_9PEZI|nr:family 4 putative glycosyltransferase [Podospora fimiseda]